ncbi:MAG: hypothetical protein WC917_03955 [Bacilli bacterium]|jgi:hypothetical protein
MKLEQQVTSLELSKKLKELGVKQESLFYWVKHRQTAFPDEKIMLKENIYGYNKLEPHAFQFEIIFSAFTVTELGKILVEKGIRDFPFIEYYSHENAECWKFKNPFTKYAEEIMVAGRVDDLNIADVFSKMLIYLIENKLITL